MINIDLLPAVNSTEAAPKLSDSYGFMNTREIIDHMGTLGFEVVKAKQVIARNKDNMAYKKHLLNLRKVDSKPVLGEVHPEIVILNSHEGTASLKMMFGLFRLVCANGLIVSAGIDELDVKLRHNMINVTKLNESVEYITAHTDTVINKLEAMQAKKLDYTDALTFAMDAMALRFTDKTPIDAVQLLASRRQEDEDDTLWKVFNRVQENLVVGGLSGRFEDGRRFTTRPVNRINGNVKLNQQLWNLAEQFLAA